LEEFLARYYHLEIGNSSGIELGRPLKHSHFLRFCF